MGKLIGFIFQGGKLLFTGNEKKPVLLDEVHAEFIKSQFIRHHVFQLSSKKTAYCAEIDEHVSLPAGIYAIPLRMAFEHLKDEGYSAAAKAFSIITWDKNHQFCGHCGCGELIISGAFEKTCAHCHLIFYPRMSPSIIVLIKKEDHILMARGHHFPAGIYGLIAGFVEAGESIEEAVHREVKEEVGLKIKNLRYFGSQPWPFPDSLMIGFTADYASGEIKIEPNEIEIANWYRYDELPPFTSSKISIAGKLIESFIAENNGKL